MTKHELYKLVNHLAYFGIYINYDLYSHDVSFMTKINDYSYCLFILDSEAAVKLSMADILNRANKAYLEHDYLISKGTIWG